MKHLSIWFHIHAVIAENNQQYWLAAIWGMLADAVDYFRKG